jgi:hypothetical protein
MKDPVAVAVQAEDLALVTTGELRYPPGELAGKEEQVLEGNVLAEGDEMNLVVAAHKRPVRRHNQRGVVVAPGLIFCRIIRADIAHDQRRLRGAAMEMRARWNRGSASTKGAGDSGHATKSGCVG